jgi:hypothetical protein
MSVRRVVPDLVSTSLDSSMAFYADVLLLRIGAAFRRE